MRILIYGANGYTGKLIVEKAVKQNLNFVISGRNENKITDLAKKFNVEYFISSIEEIDQKPDSLKDFDILINCAGPFSKTVKPILNACLKSHTHYLDITGEIEVFRYCKSMHQKAQKSDIIICPGVGFDVIPTDCLAMALYEVLPNADEILLGFESTARNVSPGTMATSIEGLGNGGKIRKDGKIKKVPLAYKSAKLDFGNGSKNMVTIPWGDVATTFYSTKIPNISVYIPMKKEQIKKMKWLNLFSFLLRSKLIINKLKQRALAKTKGPSTNERVESKMYVWGRIKKENQVYEGKLITKNGYEVTADGSLEVVNYILNNEINPGYYTPSLM